MVPVSRSLREMIPACTAEYGTSTGRVGPIGPGYWMRGAIAAANREP